MDENNIMTFQVKGIEILETNLSSPENPINDDTVFGFNLQSNQSFNLDNELVIVTCEVDIFDTGYDQKLGHLKVSCLYYLKDLKSYANEENNSISLPEGMVVTLNSISISTVRGVMYGVFRGTFLDGAILPVVDPTGEKKETINKDD
ncbi:hypothetical protein [Croceibacter atlanticus]|uniref:hypothetical protein n=1 Tax=Croceibacter atlanticus TaxID=313588 RepID=UPI0030F6B926